MQRPSRPPSPSDVKETETSGGRDPQPAGATAQTSRTNSPNSTGGRGIRRGGGGGRGEEERGGGGEPDSPSWSRTHANLGVFRPKLHVSRRSSSGYISDCDSLPSSPLSPRLVTADKATQTPSLTGQVMAHALRRMAEEEEQGGGSGMHQQQHGHIPNLQNAVADMQAAQLGRELQLIGDDYNRLLLLRRAAGRRRQAAIPLNLLPHLHQEPVALLCVSLLFILIGRIIYLQGGASSPDHSQV